VHIGDGYNGWPEAAPSDAIVVTAAPAEIPEPLIEQLKPGGRMVVPADGSSALQYLAACGKAAGWHHDDETYAAGEVRALHERSCEIERDMPWFLSKQWTMQDSPLETMP